jgi:hypothetical protein
MPLAGSVLTQPDRKSTPWSRVRRLPLLMWMSLLSCASAPASDAPTTAATTRYPRRGPGCELAVYHTPVPGVPAWDDLGVAEANCNINESPAECLRILRAEACHMGGDLMYNVPRKPFRPRDQVMQYRAQVAHSRSAQEPIKTEDADLPPPASPEEAAGPVVPLPSAGTSTP